MFRKLYKEANDNIKTDDELLEKVLASAFSEKPNKRTCNIRYFSTTAAAAVLVVGCLAAYPYLTEQPTIEQTGYSPVPTHAAALSERYFLSAPTEAAEEVTAVPEKRRNQPQQTDRSDNEPKAIETPTVSVQPAAAEETADENIPVLAAEPALDFASENATAAYTAPMVRAVITETAGTEFVQVSAYTAEDGTESFVYENTEGKSFTVSVEKLPISQQTDTEILSTDEGIEFMKNDKAYSVRSEDLTAAELTEIFTDFVTQ